MATTTTTTTTFFLLILIIFLFYSCNAAKTRGMFVFGASLVDNGNNNFLPNTTAKADYLPYGIDSKMGPSGRFSNGKNMIDALGELLGLQGPIPPFLHPDTRGRRIVHGVNYASGGSGILDQTGSIGGDVISLKEQITDFERTTLPQLKDELSNGKREENKEERSFDALSEYLFVVETGGNDYLLNYFTNKKMDDRGEVGLQDFTANLITTLTADLKRLHNLGARKFVLFSVQDIGCVPVVRANTKREYGSCVEAINEAAILFNTQLRSLMHHAKPKMPGSHMVYVNSYGIISDITRDPTRAGFKETTTPCCDLDWRTGVLCRRGGRTCRHRNSHVFFDGLHPTEAVNICIAKKAYNTRLLTEAYPINIKQLVRV